MSQHGRLPPREFRPGLRRVADWEIIGCLAGPLAELDRQGLVGPVTDREVIVEDAGGGEDLEKVDILLEDLKALGRRNPGIKRHMRLAWRLVESSAEAIEALAERLQTQHHLEQQEVWETIRPHIAAA
ncbi:hypothetical protein ASG43_08930 [Aureimonas sp. Leaf454]|nr:hypothetical protein ASG43_08930 [Aureimonas sp. Leaf454]